MLMRSRTIPSLIKYMGSKSEIIGPIVQSMNRGHRDGQPVCDLFSGSCTLAGALRRNDLLYISNDIQAYTAVLGSVYTAAYRWNRYPPVESWVAKVQDCVRAWQSDFDDLFEQFSYDRTFTLTAFNAVEEEQRGLIDDADFARRLAESPAECVRRYHLFAQYYAGTYWNFAQCVWIDCCRYVIDIEVTDEALKNALMGCLMFAMAYNSQSTGHYAQFRKAQTERSMEDILIYRRKQLEPFFIRKYQELRHVLTGNHLRCQTVAEDYLACIDRLPDGTLVYADPPYCFVHYSRFYHILETLVRYDYPAVHFDGRYREGRHQSPFCIATQVEGAFTAMFERLRDKGCSLVLSYSNSANTMMPLNQLILDAYQTFNRQLMPLREQAAGKLDRRIARMLERQIQNNRTRTLDISRLFAAYNTVEPAYTLRLKLLPYQHSTMGRTLVKQIDVFEAILEIFPRL